MEDWLYGYAFGAITHSIFWIWRAKVYMKRNCIHKDDLK